MRLAITCNGPGETAGWLMPLLGELYAREPGAQVHVFYVPDDYATGEESRVVRERFPQAAVYDPRAYLKVALGAKPAGVPDRMHGVLYLGGDLMHAARLHRRFGGALVTYKFARSRYAQATARAFAVDQANAAQLRASGVAPERIAIVGNLAVDGALLEASMPVPRDAPAAGILIMPGSRSYEVEHLVPFFFTAALRVRREDPALPIALGISPFTRLDAVRSAMEAGGDPRFFSGRGTIVEEGGSVFAASRDLRERFPIVRSALAAAAPARLVVTIPGTKVIELATIGKPVISCSPANAPELVAINGPLTYLDRVPLVGAPLKRSVVVAYARRFRYHTQPNIDAQREIVRELHGTLTPGRVARVALEHAADGAWLQQTSQAMAGLYREHVGAAARLAANLLAFANASV